ncbi:MAG: RNA 2',3'-cyclic phosphodiesterase [Syntrophales bacterium]|nr:RNA 2',3'-cyclic phosphodiesterase [Syntrophales bacterium]
MAHEQDIRAFLAIEPPADIRKALAAVQTALRREITGPVSWVRPEGIHLTLKFFGNIRREDITAIASVVEGAVAAVPPLKITVGRMGLFPGPRRPRVIWIGTGGDVARLTALQGELEKGFQNLGFAAEDRSFRPHLTLARIKPPGLNSEMAKLLIAQRDETLGTFTASSLILFRSELTPRGAIYTELATFPFRGR